jgi:hypothetical protein
MVNNAFLWKIFPHCFLGNQAVFGNVSMGLTRKRVGWHPHIGIDSLFVSTPCPEVIPRTTGVMTAYKPDWLSFDVVASTVILGCNFRLLSTSTLTKTFGDYDLCGIFDFSHGTHSFQMRRLVRAAETLQRFIGSFFCSMKTMLSQEFYLVEVY